MMPLGRRALLGGAGAAAIATGAGAQSYPSRPIRIIVPYSAGGTSDVMGRFVAEGLTRRLGQTVVVENRPSANAVVGIQYAARAAPDGYTLLMGGASTHAVNPHLYRTRPYDAIGEFTSIGLAGSGPIIISVNPSLPVHDLQQLIAYARQHPGQLAFGSSIGVTLHLAGELLKSLAGIDMLHVPYNSNTQALTDVLAGRLQVMFDTVNTSAPFIADGSLRAIAVPAARRATALPNVPTAAEAGLAGYEVTTWFALYGPAGMPADIVQRLNAELNAVLAEPASARRLADLGQEPTPSTPEQAAAYLKADYDKWGAVIQRIGLIVG